MSTEKYHVIRDENGMVLSFPGIADHDPHSIVSHWCDAEVERLGQMDLDDGQETEARWVESLSANHE